MLETIAHPVENDVDIGLRLRTVRELHGLSQRELAQRAGISNAMISLIEKNRTSPSIGLLKRILGCLNLSLSTFFATHFNSDQTFFFSHNELTEIGNDDVSLKQIGANLQNRALQLMYETFEEGAESGLDLLTHDGEEAGFVIEGRLELTVASQTRVLGPGDAYYFKSNLPHRFRNIGATKCIIVSACTPPTF